MGEVYQIESLMDPVVIPSGAILNCYMPKKRFSLKRTIMNLQAQLVRKLEGFDTLLNHTATIERDGDAVLIWEATAGRGVAPTEISRYSADAFFYITLPDNWTESEGKKALNKIKLESSVKYDFPSWVIYLKYLVSGKWTGSTSYKDYSKRWYCSEVIDHSFGLTPTPWRSTPNHVYRATKQNEIWYGSYVDLVFGLKRGNIKVI